MNFIGGSSARELHAQTDLPDPDPIDEIDYELEIELATKISESESCFEDDAPDQPDATPANNTSDLFEFFFRGTPDSRSSTVATKLTTKTTLASLTTQPSTKCAHTLKQKRRPWRSSTQSAAAKVEGKRVFFVLRIRKTNMGVFRK